MKKNHKRLLSSVLAGVMTLSMCSNALAAPVKAAAVDELVKAQEEAASKAPELLGSLDEMEVPALDDSVANQLPMTGYFSKTIEVGETKRTAKVYLADGIHIRDYFTVIAVPDGVDTEEFLTEGGWYAKADARNEGLFILEPGEGGWGTAEEEAAYVNEAIKFYSGNGYFSIYGEHYLVGYGKGGSALEYWAGANPLRVIGQVYVDSEGVDPAYLEETGKTVFPTKNGSYVNVEFPEDFELLTYDDAVLPTWYIGGAPESASYWKMVNDCTGEAVADEVFGQVYAQDADSDNWTTDYSGPISKVAVQEAEEANSLALTEKICKFLYYYTRYENAFVYGNQLSERNSLENCTFKTIEVNGHPREYMVYEPENMMENSPVMFVWPGNTQTDRVFVDATQWLDVAKEEGFMLVMICEDYNTSTSVTHKDSNEFQEKLSAQIKADYAGKVDPERFYGSGQSLGSMTTQGFVATNPEYFAAVASTSGPLMSSVTGEGAGEETYLPMPTYLIYGAGDLEFLEGDLWDDIDNSLDEWAAYVLKANNLSFDAVAADDYVPTSLDAFGHKNLRTWTWNTTVDKVEVPMVKLSKSMERSHNCISAEMPELWEYVRHFKAEYDASGNVTARYYSESAFAQDDAVVIYENDEIPCLDDMDFPALDNSVPNRLPMTGYYSKNITVGEETRTAKVYIAKEAKIRPYFTVIAVPDGVDTEDFLTENGWYEKADAAKEGLFILEPGKDGWGTAEEEAAYVNAAIGFYASNKYFSIYGEHYFVGYGKGAAAMEYWAAANPLKVISQVYVDSEGLDAEYLEETGKTVFPTQTGSYAPIVFPEDFELLVYSDAVLPTWYIGGEAEDSLAYWKSVNDCEENAAADDSFGAVYNQKEDSTRWMTDYAGPISKVAVADAEAYTKELTDKICEFSYYYTRYENGFAYSNGLYERTFYDDSCFKVIDDVNGHPREYMVYEPENMQENSPVMFVFPGNTQTDLVFMDATQWQDVADKEGILLVVVCEDYNTATTVTFKDTNEFHEKLVEQIKKDYEGKVDPTRFYGNGQSMGGMTVQGFGSTNPEYFAAIATTSGCLMDAMSGDFSQRTYEMMPTYMIYGMGDNVNFGGTLWDETDNQLDDWARYYAAANGLKVSAVAEEDGVVTPTDRNNHRFQTTWSWTKDFDGVQVPLMQLGRNSARAHNCLPTEEAELYSFAKHFRVILDDNGNVAARYYSASAFAEDDQVLIYEAPKADPLQAQVTSIQATVGADFYGHKVNKVEITFAEGTDAKALAEAAFTVYDRGSANPEFGALNVADVKVEGNKVTLTMAMGSDKVTDRSRNSFGMMNKAGWYSDSEGNIYYGKETTIDALGHYIYPNTAGKTCQGRNLDLILCINGTDITKGIMSTDGCGNMLEDTVWEETEITGGLEKIVQEYVNVGWEAADYDQVSENGEVPVQVIYPEGYDVNRAEKYPVIVYQCGGGVCYWQISKDMEKGIRADANNLGTNTVYDNMMTEWAKEFPEAIVMAVNVHSSNTANAAKEIAGVLDYAIANWNVDADKIIGVGNSQGTIIFSDVIRQRSDLVAGYVECNGNFGTMASVANTDGTLANSSFGAWTAEEVQAMVDNEVAVWMFNGETDGDNPGVAQDTYKVYSDLFRAAGKSEQWIYDHVRVSGLQSWQFKEWGETDHSVTKVVAWKYIANPYNDPNSADEILPVGATYKFTGAEDYNKYEYTMDFDYTVYEESVAEWAKKLFAGEYEEAVVQEEQTITTKSDSYLLAYGHKPYSLKAKTTGDGELTFSSNNKKVATVDKNGKVTIVGTGKATITIKASETENYKAATKKVIIRVVPKKAALKDAVSPKKGQLKIAVKKDAMASGYMVQYATNKSFKGFKTVVLNKTSMTKVTIKGMKAGKYYVRVCAYKSIGGNKYIGAYSAAKTVKVK